jgi:hypothetical protein
VAQEKVTWQRLNDMLRGTDDEKVISKLLKNEQEGANRPGWVLRIHQRLNRVRSFREQRELVGR